MEIIVKRFEFDKDYTISRVFINGEFICYAIEDEIRERKVKGETAIPYGTYNIGIRYSPRFGPNMLWVKNVPGFEYILIHTGNTDDDTEGCLILGMRIGQLNGKRAVLDSKAAYNKFYPLVKASLDKQEHVQITYTK